MKALNTQDTGGSYADPNPNLGPGTTVTQGINSGMGQRLAQMQELMLGPQDTLEAEKQDTIRG